MYTHPQQGLSPDEVSRSRKAAGAYLRSLREAKGLSQRALSNALKMEYYTFIAQIEAGRGRLPPTQMRDWARVLGVDAREFAIEMMRHYDPRSFELLFPMGHATNSRAIARSVVMQVSADAELDALGARLDRLEKAAVS